ncbi:hypothetical protein EQ826_19825 [Ectopseudomonas mendocina]|nr:phytanoyl-CoA dioxygenase family protein [Pseudomonas mendocina]TRO15862.1 hypothetical protein EQ828_20165 [Pseudomonas mendocina]TRO23046.1 hypothetical protein EQ826_19825 [Pseudomonas mendocina]
MSNIIRSPFLFALSIASAQLLSKITLKKKNHDRIVADLRKQGFSVLPDFIPAEICDLLVDSFDSLENKAKCYENDRRLFSVEKYSSMHEYVFSRSAYIKDVGDRYLNNSQILLSVMAAKLYAAPGGLGSGGGWHRDSFLPQFKSICYLTDVSEDNGPFEYVAGSHALMNKIRYELVSKTRERAHDPRYSQSSVDEYCSIIGGEIKTFTATKGTLVFCDTSGLHRGRPIDQGVRYAVTNYFKSPRVFLDKRARRGKIYSELK